MDTIFENIVHLLILSVFLETVVEGLKPLWNQDAKKLCMNQLVSMGLGVLICVLGKIDLLQGLIPTENTAFQYVLYVMTGIAVGRGPSFIHDLWQRIRTEKSALEADAKTGESKASTPSVETMEETVPAIGAPQDETAEGAQSSQEPMETDAEA